jgi:hypothetical protein
VTEHEPPPPAVAGLQAARRVERADRDAEVAEELATVAKLADELAQPPDDDSAEQSGS